MNKNFISILFLISTTFSYSQSIKVGTETSISISNNAILLVENASFEGSLANEGDLFINQSVDFLNNNQVGNVTFTGLLPSVVSGGNLNFLSLTANSSANIILTSDSIFTEKLNLQNGIIITGFTYLKTFEEIIGGSNESYIDGTLVVEKQTTSSQNYPIGKNDFYNPISLNPVPEGSITSIKIIIPDESTLIPGDSLIGINRQFGWEINYQGTPTNSSSTIQFQGIDLSDLPNKVDIKAPIYLPVIVEFDRGNEIYRSLGLGSTENSDNNTFGTIEAASTFSLSSFPILLSIGLAPTTDQLHFYIPNFFSPNSKLEENRVFRPFLAGTEVTELKLTVWDQYNRLVFSENYVNPNLNLIGWTGGNEPEGTYFYSIELKSKDGIYDKKGTVFLGR